MSKKYELMADKTIEVLGQKLFRIRALVAFGDVEAGEEGGYIEAEKNLDQSGDAWVYGDARVYGDAHVYGNARVYGDAHVYGDARVYGDAHVYGNARVYGDAHVYGDARVYGDAHVYGDARVSGDAHVFGNARVYGNAQVYGDAWVSGDAHVFGNARVYGNAQVFGNARVYGNAQVFGNARVYGDAWVSGAYEMVTFSGVGSCQRATTAFICKDKKIRVSCGCFFGTLEEFRTKVRETHGGTHHEAAYLAAADFVEKALVIPEGDERDELDGQG